MNDLTKPAKTVDRSQQGAALIVSLVILLVVTLLGVASLRSGIFHERMSLNSQAETLAFLGAESAINGIFSFALEIRENRVDDSFFATSLLGNEQQNCITRQGITAAFCADHNDVLDTRDSGVVFAQTATLYVGQTKLSNSDPDTLAYHKFSTEGTSYLLGNLDLPFASKNLQEWQMLGVVMPFAVSRADVVAARQAGN